jgi:hypothetical protein
MTGPFGQSAPDGGTDSVTAAREQIRRAWADLADRVAPRRETMTPGEIARIAVERGYPADAVDSVTDAMRAVEYGERDPDSYLERVRTAAERLRAPADDGGDDR